jgi:hypothetical protein
VRRKQTLTLEEAKAVLDKLAELGSEVSEVREAPARRLQELVDDARNAQRAIEEALAPLLEASREWAGGRWARNMVVNTADRTLSKIGADSETSAAVRSCRSDFVASFEAFAADAELKRATREAILEAIVNALYIGLASDDPSLLTRLRNDQAAHARRGKPAPNETEELAAVQWSLKRKEPADSLPLAKLIAGDVEKKLGKKLSPRTIRRRLKRLVEMQKAEGPLLKSGPQT